MIFFHVNVPVSPSSSQSCRHPVAGLEVLACPSDGAGAWCRRSRDDFLPSFEFTDFVLGVGSSAMDTGLNPSISFVCEVVSFNVFVGSYVVVGQSFVLSCVLVDGCDSEGTGCPYLIVDACVSAEKRSPPVIILSSFETVGDLYDIGGDAFYRMWHGFDLEFLQRLVCKLAPYDEDQAHLRCEPALLHLETDSELVGPEEF